MIAMLAIAILLGLGAVVIIALTTWPMSLLALPLMCLSAWLANEWWWRPRFLWRNQSPVLKLRVPRRRT